MERLKKIETFLSSKEIEAVEQRAIKESKEIGIKISRSALIRKAILEYLKK